MALLVDVDVEILFVDLGGGLTKFRVGRIITTWTVGTVIMMC